ncbi:MAG TPA: tetratricopeptide repeat protein [Longimicrobiaceae bacterium]|nr:tetratricopeptide repeat protein [Longimicrobiaceae bacterium]
MSFLLDLPGFAESDSEAGDVDNDILQGLDYSQTLGDTGDLLATESEAAAALRSARRERDEQGIALAGLATALVYLARGRCADARRLLADAARSFMRGGDALRKVQSHYLLGEIAYLAEDPIRAGSHYRDALAVAREAGMQEWIELLTLKFEHR